MKFKTRFRLTVIFLVGCFICACSSIFDDDFYNEPTYEPVFTFDSDKITAEYAYHFGLFIANANDHVIVSDYEDIYIFSFDGSSIALVQTINFTGTSGIWSMTIHNSSLLFGHADAYGTGTVYVYDRNGNTWDLSQEINIGRVEDLFGSDIDIDGDIMVIGASAPWIDDLASWENKDEGRAYIYRLQDGLWVQNHEFVAENTEGDDRFGTCVAAHEDLVLVGSPLAPLHIYRLEDSLVLLRTEEIQARVMEHSGNNFLVGGDYELWSFILESDGSFTETTISDFNATDISWDGEIIEMKDSLAIIDVVDDVVPSDCYLYRFENQIWTEELVFSPDPGEDCTFHGMAFSDQYAIVGGMSYSDSRYSYIYFHELPD